MGSFEVKFIVLLLACLPLLAAEEVESIHNFVWEGGSSPAFTAQFLGQLRMNSHFLNLAQFQGGPMLTLRKWDWLRPFAGYYFIETENFQKDFQMVHRPFGGAIVPLWRRNGAEVSSRTMVERIMSGASEDYTRFRERFLWRWRRRGLSPYGSAEALHALQGWLMRYEGGASISLPNGFNFLTGYQYRQYRDGHLGHIVVTTLQFGGTSQTGR